MLAAIRIQNAAIGLQPLPCHGKRLFQIVLVERDDGGNARIFCSDQGARQLAFREHGLCRNHDQYLIEVGSKRLGANFILAVEQVAAFQHFFNRAFLALPGGRGLPQHTVTDDRLAFLAARVANAALAIGRFNDAVTAMATYDQALRGGFSGCNGGFAVSAAHAALTVEGVAGCGMRARRSTAGGWE